MQGNCFGVFSGQVHMTHRSVVVKFSMDSQMGGGRWKKMEEDGRWWNKEFQN